MHASGFGRYWRFPMTDVDAILSEAGRRWRDEQPDPPDIDFAVVTREPNRRWRLRAVVGLAGVVAIAAVFVFAVNRPGAAPAASGPAGPACVPTKPSPPFVPPSGYPPVPPNSKGVAWFGSAALWTLIDVEGETWLASDLPHSAAGLTQKTFWWSSRWSPDGEPTPAITVSGTRLDGAGSFAIGPGTNAGADFGTAMLVGVDIPTPGCWRLTGTYRGESLSYTVLIEDR
jgi:hypothetical protein